MKLKILIFVGGLIIGAAIASGVFLYLNNGKSTNGDLTPPQGFDQNGTRPEKPTENQKNKTSSTTTETTTDSNTDTTNTQ